MGAASHWRRLRRGWRRSDTVLHGSNIAVFAALVLNCGIGSPWLVLVVCCAALALQGAASRFDPALRRAWLLGLGLGLSWPFGEGLVVRLFGWWGAYLAPGPRIWDTPLYCVVIGALASAHCAFVGKRAEELGYGLWGWAVVSGLSALAVGALGENLFVWSGMWRYEEAAWMIGDVPAFVPVGYGLCYAALPLLRRLSPIPQSLAFNGLMLVLCVGLGIASGFFPR